MSRSREEDEQETSSSDNDDVEGKSPSGADGESSNMNVRQQHMHGKHVQGLIEPGAPGPRRRDSDVVAKVDSRGDARGEATRDARQAKRDAKQTAEMDHVAVGKAVADAAGGFLPQEERETLRRAQVLIPRDAFPMREADTLTAPEYGTLTERGGGDHGAGAGAGDADSDDTDDGSTATLPRRRADHSLRRAETLSPPPPDVHDAHQRAHAQGRDHVHDQDGNVDHDHDHDHDHEQDHDHDREERRDTMPAPPIASDPMTARAAHPLPHIASGGTVTLLTAPVSLLLSPSSAEEAKSKQEHQRHQQQQSLPVPPPPPSSRSCVSPLPTRLGTPRAGSPLPPPPVPIPIPPLDDEDNILDGEDLLEDDYEDMTQASTEPVVRSSSDRHQSGDDQTSPTLSLANRSDASREVYRLFLASEYAPALELANELIAQGDDDPMLITIARECRSSLANPNQTPSSVPPSMEDDEEETAASQPHESAEAVRPSLRALVSGRTTMDELSRLTGMPLDQILSVFDRLMLERRGDHRRL